MEHAIQNGSYGPICIQLPEKEISLVQLPPEPSNGTTANPPSGRAVPPPSPPASEGEKTRSCTKSGIRCLILSDCLFLDVYVPAKAIGNPSIRLPVISWFYGGGFINGAKDLFTPLIPFYDGRGPIAASDGNVIFISSNYRVSKSSFIVPTYQRLTHCRCVSSLELMDFLRAQQWKKKASRMQDCMIKEPCSSGFKTIFI